MLGHMVGRVGPHPYYHTPIRTLTRHSHGQAGEGMQHSLIFVWCC